MIRDLLLYVLVALTFLNALERLYDYITVTRPMNQCAERAKLTGVASCEVRGARVTIWTRKEPTNDR